MLGGLGLALRASTKFPRLLGAMSHPDHAMGRGSTTMSRKGGNVTIGLGRSATGAADRVVSGMLEDGTRIDVYFFSKDRIG